MSVREAAAWVSVAFPMPLPTPMHERFWWVELAVVQVKVHSSEALEALNHPQLVSTTRVHAGLAHSTCTVFFSHDADD